MPEDQQPDDSLMNLIKRQQPQTQPTQFASTTSAVQTTPEDDSLIKLIRHQQPQQQVQQTQQPTQPSEDDSLMRLIKGQSHQQPQQQQPQAKPEPIQNTDESDPLLRLIKDQNKQTQIAKPISSTPTEKLGNEADNTDIKAQQNMDRLGENESWYNRSIITTLGKAAGVDVGEYREGAGPVERAVEKFGSGLLSPLSLALMLGTGMLGGVAEAGAAVAGEEAIVKGGAQGFMSLLGKVNPLAKIEDAGKALGEPLVDMISNKLSPAAALKVVNASKVLSKAANIGFTGQQLLGIADAYHPFVEAIHDGDTDKAIEVATGATLSGVMAGLSTGHFLRQAFGEQYRPTFVAHQAAEGQLDTARNNANYDINELHTTYGDLLKTHKDELIALNIYKEHDGNLDSIKAEAEAVQNLKLPEDIKKRQLELYTKAQSLSDRVIELGNHLVDNVYPKYADMLKQTGKLGLEADLDKNYLGSREYVFDEDNDLGSGVNFIGMKKAGFLKRRVFSGRLDALENGFIPKDVDVLEAHSKYRTRLAEVVGDHGVENVLRSTKDDNGNPVAVSGFNTKEIHGQLHQVLDKSHRVGQLELDRIASMTPDMSAKITGVEIHNIQDSIADLEQIISDQYSPEALKGIKSQARAADLKDERYYQELTNFLKANPRKAATTSIAQNTVGTQSGAEQGTNFFQQAKEHLGKDASISEIAQYAQKLKEATVPAGSSGFTIGDIKSEIHDDGFSMHTGTANRQPELRHDIPIMKDGEEIAHALLTVSEDGKIGHIGWIGRRDTGEVETGEYKGKPKIGMDGVKDLMRQVKRKIPTLETLEGHRMSGAHAGGDKTWQVLRVGEKVNVGEPEKPKPPREVPVVHFTHPEIKKEMTLPYDKFSPAEIAETVKREKFRQDFQKKTGQIMKEFLSPEERLEQWKANNDSRTQTGTPEEQLELAAESTAKQWKEAMEGAKDLGFHTVPEKISKLDARIETLKKDARPLPKIDSKRVSAINGQLVRNINDYIQAPKKFSRYAAFDDKTVEKPLWFHPGYNKRLLNLWDNHSWIKENLILRPLLKAASITKGSVLALSPFHWATEAERGIQMGMNPNEVFRPDSITKDRRAMTSNFPPLLGSDSHRIEAEGVAGFNINKLPFLKQVHDKLFGFDGYISRLKANAFDRVTDQISKKNPTWTPDQVDFASSRIVDGAFGGLNWKSYGWSMNSVDALRLFMLAPDFTGSQIAFAKAGFEPGGSVANQSLARIALYNFAVARITNLLYTGNLQMDHPFGLVSKDGEKVYNVRTMPADFAHALTDPRGFAYYRLSPTAKYGAELTTGKDEYGHRVTAQQEVHDLLRNVLPISLQNALPSFQKPGETLLGGIGKSSGLSPELNKSQAGKTADNLASHYSSDGAVDPDKLEKHQKVLLTEDALRSGKITMDDVFKAQEEGKLSIADAKQIRENMRKTQGLDYPTAYTYNRSSRLPMHQFLQVWQEANPTEKKALEPLLRKKRSNYFHKAAQTMTPTERQHDETYMRLRKLFPAEAPY